MRVSGPGAPRAAVVGPASARHASHPPGSAGARTGHQSCRPGPNPLPRCRLTAGTPRSATAALWQYEGRRMRPTSRAGGPVAAGPARCVGRAEGGHRSLTRPGQRAQEVAPAHRLVINRVVGLPGPTPLQRGHGGHHGVVQVDPRHGPAVVSGEGEAALPQERHQRPRRRVVAVDQPVAQGDALDPVGGEGLPLDRAPRGQVLFEPPSGRGWPPL